MFAAAHTQNLQQGLLNDARPHALFLSAPQLPTPSGQIRDSHQSVDRSFLPAKSPSARSRCTGLFGPQSDWFHEVTSISRDLRGEFDLNSLISSEGTTARIIRSTLIE
jgi:hypothetical protein